MLRNAVDQYSDLTASTQADTETPLSGVSVSSFHEAMSQAMCRRASLRDLDWTPEQEEILIPDPIAAACAQCPVRAMCLQWATENEEWGYWASTTRADREQLVSAGTVTLAAAEALQQEHVTDDLAIRLHGDEPPSLRWYRAGCHCVGCRRCNRDRSRVRRALRRGA